MSNKSHDDAARVAAELAEIEEIIGEDPPSETQKPDLKAAADGVKILRAGEMLPVAREPKPEIVAASCDSCIFFARMKPGSDVGTCRAHAPTAILKWLAPPPLEGQQPIPVVDGFFPPTNKTVWCGEWRLPPQGKSN